MHQWRATRYDVQSLESARVPIPEPGEHQLLVKVGAVSLNYRDKLALQGTERAEWGRLSTLDMAIG